MTGRVDVARIARSLGDVASVLVARRGARGSLLVRPTSPGSEGDALLVAGLARLVGPPLRIGAGAPETWGTLPVDVGTSLLLRAAVARGETVDGRALAAAAARPWTRAWFLGADILDGAYGTGLLGVLDRLDRLAAEGVPTGVCSFSWRAAPHRKAVRRLQATAADTVFVARGERSAARFREDVGRECVVAPDVSWAVLGDEYAAVRAATPAGPNGSPGSRTRLGVNLSLWVCRAADAVAPGHLVDVVAQVVERRRAAGDEAVMVPHDERPPQVSDVAELAPLVARLAPPRPELVMVRGPELRRRIAACDVLLTGRMHAAISALAFGVPVVALGYNDKFEDVTDDPVLDRYVRILDPTSGGLADELDALHERQRVRLAGLAALITARGAGGATPRPQPLAAGPCSGSPGAR